MGIPNHLRSIYSTPADHDLEPVDSVYINGQLVTGAFLTQDNDSPIAYNSITGHQFAVFGGDINQEEGATLQVKYLWDNEVVATIENYTRPFLGQGDGGIEIYQVTYGQSTPLRQMAKAYIDAFSNGVNPFDPLVLDLDGDGIELGNNPNQGVYFDMDADGFAERTSWVKADDGLLVRDLNGNGTIDTINELFGNESTSGFVELSALDTSGNNKISANDAAWSELQIWQDLNQNGISEANELQSLDDWQIDEIRLDAVADGSLHNGNTIVATASVRYSDGTYQDIADIGFDVRQQDSQYLGSDNVSAAADALPWLKGRGNLVDLDVAMTNDSALLSQVSALASSVVGDYGSYDTAIEAILFQWAGVQGVAAGKRCATHHRYYRGC